MSWSSYCEAFVIAVNYSNERSLTQSWFCPVTLVLALCVCPSKFPNILVIALYASPGTSTLLLLLALQSWSYLLILVLLASPALSILVLVLHASPDPTCYHWSYLLVQVLVTSPGTSILILLLVSQSTFQHYDSFRILYSIGFQQMIPVIGEYFSMILRSNSSKSYLVFTVFGLSFECKFVNVYNMYSMHSDIENTSQRY